MCGGILPAYIEVFGFRLLNVWVVLHVCFNTRNSGNERIPVYAVFGLLCQISLYRYFFLSCTTVGSYARLRMVIGHFITVSYPDTPHSIKRGDDTQGDKSRILCVQCGFCPSLFFPFFFYWTYVMPGEYLS